MEHAVQNIQEVALRDSGFDVSGRECCRELGFVMLI